MSGGANNPGGMNPSPTGGTLTGFDVKLRRGQDPSLRCKPLKGIQWQGCGPGMPGPYGLLRMGCEREGRGRAAARPLRSGRRLPVDEWHSKVAGRACPAPTDCCFRHRGFGALGGAQRAPPVCFANTLVRLFAPQGQTLLAPQFRCAQLWPRARNPATPDSKVEEGAGALRTKSNTAFV